MASTTSNDGIIPTANVVTRNNEENTSSSDKSGTPTVDIEKGQQHASNTATDADAPFSIWNTTERRLIILCASSAALFSPLSAQIYYPALNEIAHDLHASSGLINLSITTYMVSKVWDISLHLKPIKDILTLLLGT